MSTFSQEEYDEQEETILSFESLREAFQNVDSDDDDFFTWEGESEPDEKKRNTPTPYSWAQPPGLSIYPDHDEEENEESDDNSSEDTADFEEEPLQDETASESYAGVSEEEPIKLNPISLFEAMLFVGDKENRPLPPEKAANLMRNVSPEEIIQIADALNARYAFLNCPYEVVREKSGFRLRLKNEFESIRTKFYGRIKEARLTQTAIDVLSIIAYKQPISAEEVERILKQPPNSVLSQLVRRDLLHIVQKTEKKSKTAYYQTTDRFLQLFGIENLDQLPIADDLET